MIIRDARAADMGALASIFYRAVQDGAAEAYSQAQRDVWAGREPTLEAWAGRLDGLLTLVAEDGGQVRGFMSAKQSDGYIDLAFVDPDLRGQGVAASIYAVLENRLRAARVARLHTHASHLAKPFFTRAGWTTLRANQVRRGGQTLDNWLMEKHLS